jgi:hypothetical protein
MLTFFPFLKGDSKSTKASHAAAEALFDVWRSQEGKSTFREIKRDEFCIPELHKLFSGFIVEDHISKSTNNHLSLGTVLNFSSNILVMGKDELFPNDIFFEELDDKKDNWYSRMCSKMERVIVQRCIDNAQPVSDKVPAIGRDDLLKILEAHISHGTRDSIVRAVALGTTYSANGRGSDIMTATWNLYHKHSIAKIFGFDWRTRKTSRS